MGWSVLGRLLVLFFLCFPFSFPASAEISKTLYQKIHKSAEEAVDRGDKKQAHFWMARYLGLSLMHPVSGGSSKDLEGLVKKMTLSPKGFISAQWGKDFIDWFETGIYSRWGVDEKKVRAKHRSFEIAQNRYEEKYFVTITACPEIEFWHTVEDGLLSRPLLLPMGSASDRPTLFFGKIFKGFSSLQFNSLHLNTQKKSLHYVWQPEFYDLDKDGIPEVWIRFNIAWGNGFLQILEIYRIQNDSELVLLKHFQSGEEGVARRLDNGDVELGTAFSSQKTNARFSNHQHRLEVWQYTQGAFEKISEKTIPSLFQSSEWKNYFQE